ncbi:hypothetical protein [Cupriavidus taiwanensis]|uniref:Uncharacterized protein n=1 Tax=Cupriavidus taiwanensis TaxID=164546 RepID=A0A975X3Q3_9BURK|nr:hypothetical protein CBM2587_A80014 [Cupriavidus taiwanensis]
MNPTPEELAGLIAHGIDAALQSRAGLGFTLTPERLADLIDLSMRAYLDPMRSRIEELEAEVTRLQAKSAGGVLTLAQR